MRYRLLLLLLSLLKASLLCAQEKTVLISPEMYEKAGRMFLSSLDGWIYHPGDDSTWARKKIDISNWQKLRPMDINPQLADENGMVEGWFRLKIKIDERFSEPIQHIRYHSWAAVDLYIDGQLIQSYGNTGHQGQGYQEFVAGLNGTTPIHLIPGKEYLLALHWVDQIALTKSTEMKGDWFGANTSLYFCNEKYAQSITHITKYSFYYQFAVTLIISAITALVWVLCFLNWQQKYLFYLALYLSGMLLNSFLNLLGNLSTVLGFYERFYISAAWDWGMLILLLTTPLLLVYIIQGKVLPKWKWITLFFFILFVILFWLQSVVGLIFPFFIIFFTFYLIYIHWHLIQGAQWALFGGLFLMILMFTFVFFMDMYMGTDAYWFKMPLWMVNNLILPFAIITFVALRFREIIQEVLQNAEEVLKITEEKKEILENQNKVLEQKVQERTEELETSLENLKATQAQLIQAEKLASLGELTAGIAHEIQNPLNFVNNFSEVSQELIEEMQEEIEKDDKEEAKAISEDLKQNLEKINHHGKRADAIVKGMLEHSRISTGEKTPTDINALADEYLRLSYHGLRAKDKSFNSDFEVQLETNLPQVNVVAQDIGRVLLNLINNAFYAVHQKSQKEIEDYQARVIVQTKSMEDRVEISVQDNGTGIPEHVQEKIFQPFFTTKPTGQGTGLGLSLSYDIVKAHQGQLSIETKEGEFTKFFITLPKS